jgi:hypothetical protein
MSTSWEICLCAGGAAAAAGGGYISSEAAAAAGGGYISSEAASAAGGGYIWNEEEYTKNSTKDYKSTIPNQFTVLLLNLNIFIWDKRLKRCFSFIQCLTK